MLCALERKGRLLGESAIPSPGYGGGRTRGQGFRARHCASPRKPNGPRQEQFACHIVEKTTKALNKQRIFAARLMQNPYMLRIWQKLRALGVAATGDFGGSDRALDCWVAKRTVGLRRYPDSGGEPMTTPHICPQCGQLMELSGSGQFWYFPRCKRSSGAFSISESHGSTLHTLRTMQMR
jgi:hypothetical protein